MRKALFVQHLNVIWLVAYFLNVAFVYRLVPLATKHRFTAGLKANKQVESDVPKKYLAKEIGFDDSLRRV